MLIRRHKLSPVPTNNDKIRVSMDKAKRTAKIYGFLWKREKDVSSSGTWHFNAMQEAIGEPIIRGNRGIEVGSGCGFDSYIMAKGNPSVRLVSMDISDGIYRTKELTSKFGNVSPVQCSALSIPFKGDTFDFAYSFGVLHHTSDPEKGLFEIARVLKKNSPAFLYLYEDHSENMLKYIAIKAVSWLRLVTVKMPPKLLYALSYIGSPIVFMLFTVPAKILSKFKATAGISEKMPFNFGTTPLSLRGDLYDRFSAPIECRYSRKGACDMFARHGFSNVHITRLKNTAGWVVWGYKNNA